MSEDLPNVLAGRYASAEMKNLWSQSGKIVMEREFWIAVMRAQRELGVKIEKSAITNSEKVKLNVDLESIRKREEVTKHDVKARLEEFASLSGHQHAHKGMTSRDLTENVEQLQIHRSLGLILEKGVVAILALGRKAEEFKDIPITARSHNVPAQLTTLGKRLANYGEELERSLESLSRLCATYPYRGLKGQLEPVWIKSLCLQCTKGRETGLQNYGAPRCPIQLGKRGAGLST